MYINLCDNLDGRINPIFIQNRRHRRRRHQNRRHRQMPDNLVVALFNLRVSHLWLLRLALLPNK